MNKTVQKILDEMQEPVDLEAFAKQVVGETILAILTTDHKRFIYTLFDQDRADGVISRIVDNVRNHWSFEND
jgi:hypothetical protein